MGLFIQSFSSFFGASKFIRKNKLYYFYIIPFLVSLVAYYFLFKMVSNYTQLGIDLLTDRFGIEAFIQTHETAWRGKILQWFEWLIKIILVLFAFVITMIINKYILLAVLSPWFAYISEKTENVLFGSEYKTNISQLLKDAWRGVLISGRNFVYELSINLTCFVLSIFVPVLAPIVFAINLYAGSYFYGFSMLDYVCERKTMNVKESVSYIRKNKQITLGIGLGMWLLNYIPIFGLTYASVNGAVSASLQLSESDK
jgi:CysZ protein